MLETLMTSKIRVVLIKHFLGHPQERFYLRQLERLLEQPLTPMRMELIRLRDMGLLKEEKEANLKFYRINEAFEHLAELGKLVGIEKVEYNWLLPAVGLLSLFLIVLQMGLFYIWTHPVEDLKLEARSWKLEAKKAEKEPGSFSPNNVLMSSGNTRLESGGFGGWQ